MAEVEFIYNGISTIIQCKSDEKMKIICQKFKDKIKIVNNNIIYSYNGKIGINEELTFEEILNSEDKKRNKISILVYDIETEIKGKDIVKSKNIICPECKENIKMDIIDYKVNIYECKNGHKIQNILLNEFEETQNIDRNNIICNICKKNNKSLSYNNQFYKCLICGNNICPLCKSNHDNTHKIINYDDKYYICDKHNDYYISYCEECKINLCTLCEGHKNHKRLQYSDCLPKKKELIDKKNELKSVIHKFNNEINSIINILNGVKNKMNI